MLTQKAFSLGLICGLIFSTGIVQADESSLKNVMGAMGAGLLLGGGATCIVSTMYTAIQALHLSNLTENKEVVTVWDSVSGPRTFIISRQKPQEELEKNKEKIYEHGLKALGGMATAIVSGCGAAFGLALMGMYPSR